MMLSGKLNITVSKMAGLMADGRNSPAFACPGVMTAFHNSTTRSYPCALAMLRCSVTVDCNGSQFTYALFCK